MEDKTKVSLLYTLIGGLLGALSALLSILGVPNTAVLLLYIGVIYGVTYLYFVVGVKFERLGEARWRSALNGVWPSLMPWLVIWTMVFFLISPVVILAGPSDSKAAEDLGQYLETNGISVNISDDYTRYLFAHRVIVLGSRMSLPLGTNYGITAFPDAVQRLLSMEKDKNTITTEQLNAGELITVKKPGRTIIVLSGDDMNQIILESQERVLILLQ